VLAEAAGQKRGIGMPQSLRSGVEELHPHVVRVEHPLDRAPTGVEDERMDLAAVLRETIAVEDSGG